MTKYFFLLLPLLAFSNPISMEHATKKPLGKIVRTNAQITQLSDQKQKIVSRLPGHVEAYFVKTGQQIKTGDKVALI
jgi:biotin carboxyl carrier protein